MTPLRLALLNLTRRRFPTGVALVAIALSVATSGVLLRLYVLSQSRFASLARVGDAVVGAKSGGLDILLGAANLEGPYPDFLPYALFESLRAKKAVMFEDGARATPRFIREIIPFVYFATYGGYRVIGTDASFLNRPDPADSPGLSSGKWAERDEEVVLGSDVARAARLAVGDKIALTAWTTAATQGVTSATYQATVVGTLSPGGTSHDRALFASVGFAHRVLREAAARQPSIWKENVLHYFLVYVEPDGMSELEALVNRRTVGQVVSVSGETRRLEALTGTGRRLGLLLSLLILGLGGLSVLAMMVTRFEALATQLAVLRAIGYDQLALTKWLLWEGLLLGTAACLLGALLDAAFFPPLRAMLGSALPPASVAGSSLFQSAIVWALALVATLGAALIPLWRLARANVHDSLKGF